MSIEQLATAIIVAGSAATLFVFAILNDLRRERKADERVKSGWVQ